MMKEIIDIINLKEQVGLKEEDATFRKQVQWYNYLLSNNMVELEYDGDKLIGFIEWVHISTRPKDISSISQDIGYCDFTKGPVALVCNAISLKKAIYKLRMRFLNKIKDVELICWHRKKSNKMLYFRNIRHAMD